MGKMSCFGSMMELEGRDFIRARRCFSSRVNSPEFSVECNSDMVFSAEASTRGGTRVKGGIGSKGTSEPVLAVHLIICLYIVLDRTFCFSMDDEKTQIPEK